MKNILRNLILSLTLFVGAAAYGQPVPPYTIEINGRIPGFSWNAPPEYATITSLPGTEPAISVQALIFPSNDARFGVVLNMNTFVGGFDISVPCNGSTVSTTVQYVANAIPPAQNILYVTLNCGTSLPDCELVLGGSAYPATPCDDGNPSTLNTFWNAACQCINIADSIGPVTVSGTVSNCSGAGQPVDLSAFSSIHIATTVLTDANCVYTYTFYPQFQSGNIEATTFCNNAIEPTGGFDNWGPGNMDLTIDLDCGNGPAPCQACFTVEQAYTAIDTLPFTALFTNCSSGGVGPYDYAWSFDGGLTFEQLTDSAVVFDAGAYNVCLMMTSSDGCVSTTCDSIVVDPNGGINTIPAWYDCEGVLWGPAVAGSSCDDGDPDTFYDMYMPNCICSGVPAGECLTWVDWYQALDGGAPVPFEVEYNAATAGAQPITYSWYFGDVTIGLPLVLEGTSTVPNWSRTFSGGEALAFMVVAVDANGCESSFTNTEAIMSCDGILGSLAQPALPCTTALGLPGTWNDNCECLPNVGLPCEAGFWVLQAYDSTASGGVEPIPNELWIWNLSTGSGTYQFTWDFGDGTTSIEPYPTHVYGTSGPYLLCLTLLDDAGCTSTYCDSLTLDEDGIYNGLVGDGNSRAGFTLNVLNELPNAIDERETLGEIALWPNPATDVVVVSLASMNSTLVEMSIIDLNGRMVQTTSSALNTGNNKVLLPIGQLDNGLYLVRISDGRTTVGHRFVKQ